MVLFNQVHLFSFFLFLSLCICSNQVGSLLNHQEAAQENIVEKMIGSKPPTCEELFFQNGKCKPVQVPVVSKDELKTTLSSSNGEDYSNYKPLSWKCKCGDFILTP
ncbi:hypothetical protein LUZ60_006202 [Juncus effusus]|nr:hypothetical protein LUZ60_006202 [Juncus effusus]